MADILDEILNDEKDKKRLMLFRRALPIIIGLTIVVAVSIGIHNWNINKDVEHNRKIGDMFVELTSREYSDAAIVISELDNLIKISNNKQLQLAELKIAAQLISDKKVDIAMKKLSTIIDSKNYEDITTSFARVLWASLALDDNEISDARQVQFHDYLQYFINEDQPFFATATLIKALFYKQNNQNDLASEHANILLKLKNAPLILKEQARAILASIELY